MLTYATICNILRIPPKPKAIVEVRYSYGGLIESIAEFESYVEALVFADEKLSTGADWADVWEQLHVNQYKLIRKSA